MAGGRETFQIIDGVRRSKAFELGGAKTIRAQVLNPDGTRGPEIDVLIDDLRSPKSALDMSTTRQADRFWKIWQAVQVGRAGQLPPILVSLGSQGILVRDVGWIY
jgi:hypothetical protein